MSYTRKAIQVVLPALIVAGCSSDSSPFFPSDGPAAGVPGPANQLPITSTNASDAAREAYISVVESTAIVDVALEVGINFGDGVAVSKASGPTLKPGNVADLVLMAPFGPSVLNCETSGTVTIAGDVETPTGLSVGDTINLVYNNCASAFGTANGTVNTTVDQFEQDPDVADNYSLGLSMILSDYQLTANGITETTNGDVGAIVDSLGAPDTFAYVAAGSSTNFANQSGSTTLSNYLTSEIFTIGAGGFDYTVNARGTVSSSALASAVTYSTPVPFTGREGEFPSAGELLVQGSSSSVRLVANSNVSVRLDIDSNGDGEVDDSIETTWTDVAND